MLLAFLRKILSKPTLKDGKSPGYEIFQNNFLGRFWIEIWIALICLVLGVSAIAIPQLSPQLRPAQAATPCRLVNGHEICLLRMKRSAKRYWEYQARVSVDGVRRPMELYDCRDRLRLPSDGTFVPYWQDEAVDVVCTLFKQRQIRRNAPPASLGIG